jgi:hypothetical protein
VYDTCELISSKLSNEVTRENLEAFNSQCFAPWKSIYSSFEKYTVKATIVAKPKIGNAPLIVTLN